MRSLHRWISLPAFLFLLMVAITGVLLQFQQFTSPDEAERERLDKITSPQLASAPVAGAQQQIDRALAAVKSAIGTDTPVDSIELQLKDSRRKVVVWTSSGGGSNKAAPLKLTLNADTGAVLKSEPGDRESFLLRLHTGEVFGDAGVVMGMIWGTALVALTLTGAWLYWTMYRARARVKNWRRIFW